MNITEQPIQSRTHTISKLIEYFRKISNNSPDVKQYNSGEVYEFAQSASESYPGIFLELPVSVRSLGTNQEELGFALVISGSINHNSNIDEQSDKYDIAINILGDVLATLENDNTYNLINYNYITIDSFSDDDIAGVRVELTLGAIRDYSKCANLLTNNN